MNFFISDILWNLICLLTNKRCHYQGIKCFGGDERVRTSAPCYRPNCLANSPLHHLGTSPNNIYIKLTNRFYYNIFLSDSQCFLIKNISFFRWYALLFFGGEGGIRTHGTLQTHANFQDWCHKPTRPPLRVALTIFILPHSIIFCQ